MFVNVSFTSGPLRRVVWYVTRNHCGW